MTSRHRRGTIPDRDGRRSVQMGNIDYLYALAVHKAPPTNKCRTTSFYRRIKPYVDRCLDIAFIGRLLPQRGGLATFNSQLLLGLAALGHRIRGADPVTPMSQRGPLPNWFTCPHENVSIIAADTPGYDTVSVYSAGSQSDRARQKTVVQDLLTRWWKERRFDLVVIGGEFSVWGIPDFCQAYGVPSVITAAGMIEAVADGAFPLSKAQPLLEQVRRCDLLIACAKFMKNRFRQFGFERVMAISNGVDVQCFTPKEKNPFLMETLSIEQKDIVVLHASNLQPVKRPLDIVESAAMALREELKLVYLIFGEGPLRVAAEELCSRRGVSDRFRFVDWVPHDQMCEYYSLADIVMMPSASEGLSLVYLEAMACGRALLVSDISAAREVIDDKVTGFLFDRGDIDDLVDKTMRLAVDPAARLRVGRNARRLVSRSYRLENAVAGYSTILQEVVERRLARNNGLMRR